MPHRTDHVMHKLVETVEKHPKKVSAAALIVGFLVGLIL